MTLFSVLKEPVGLKLPNLNSLKLLQRLCTVGIMHDYMDLSHLSRKVSPGSPHSQHSDVDPLCLSPNASSGSPQSQHSDASSGKEHDPPTMDELDVFVKQFKKRRINLGFSQSAVGSALGPLCGHEIPQAIISRFEASMLKFKNMCKLKVLLQKWLDEATSMSVPATSIGPASAQSGNKRKRQGKDDSQKLALEQHFHQQPKPSSCEISSIADSLQLEKKLVRHWFGNRRQKEKRMTMPSRIERSQDRPLDSKKSSGPSEQKRKKDNQSS